VPVKKRAAKGRAHKITPEAVEAFKAGDYRALHRALGLAPWEASPLPIEVTALGVDQGPPGPGADLWVESWPKAQELQRLLLQEVAEQGSSALSLR
jgi:hypothetical protein